MVIGADFSILWQLLSNFSAFEQALCSQASNFYPVFFSNFSNKRALFTFI